jgi:hypothetical protein
VGTKEGLSDVLGSTSYLVITLILQSTFYCQALPCDKCKEESTMKKKKNDKAPPPEDSHNITARIEVLKSEYLMLQEAYQDIDKQGFTIKGWSITVAAGAVGAGLINGQEMLLWLGFISSLVFWFLEAKWRGQLHFYRTRIIQIEERFVNGECLKLTPLQLYSEWEKEYNQVGSQTWKYICKSFTFLPHIIIAAASLLLAILFHIGWVQI